MGTQKESTDRVEVATQVLMYKVLPQAQDGSLAVEVVPTPITGRHVDPPAVGVAAALAVSHPMMVMIHTRVLNTAEKTITREGLEPRIKVVECASAEEVTHFLGAEVGLAHEAGRQEGHTSTSIARIGKAVKVEKKSDQGLDHENAHIKCLRETQGEGEVVVVVILRTVGGEGDH